MLRALSRENEMSWSRNMLLSLALDYEYRVITNDIVAVIRKRSLTV